jgi:hypothetical protein
MIYAWNIILMRQQALAARPVEIAFFQNLVVCATFLAVMPLVGVPAAPHSYWWELIAAALLALVSQLTLAWAYARGGAAFLSSTEYSSFLWAMLLGFAMGAGVLPAELAASLTAAVALSMAATPLLMMAWQALSRPRASDQAPPENTFEDDRPSAIVAGYGRFGQIVARVLQANGFVVSTLDVSVEQIALLRRFGRQVYYGDASRLDLLPSVIARPHERAALHVTEPELHADLVEAAELVGRDVAIERDVAVRGTEVLTEREDVDVDRSEILHDGGDLLVRLAHPLDDARIGGDVRRETLRGGEDVHHSSVSTAGTALLVQPRHRLGVVVVDVRLRLEDGADRSLSALEIRDQHLDRGLRAARLDLADRLGKCPGAEIGEVVAIDGREHDVLQPHRRRRFRNTLRLRGIELRRPPVGDGAVGAVPGADIAENHEGRGAVLPALADVRAMRFLAHRVEVQVAHELLEAQVVRASGRLHLEPGRLPLRKRLGPMPAHDLVEGFAHVQREGSGERRGK